MDQKKVIILIAADGEGYQGVVQAIKETWASTKMKDFEILYCYGHRDGLGLTSGGCIRRDDKLFCGVDPVESNPRFKIAFKYIDDNYDFEYLFLSCCGRYLIRENILKFLLDKSTNKFYYGAQGCMFISKDLVKLVNDNPSGSYLDRTIPSDAAFVKFFKENGILFKAAPTQQFFKENDVLVAQSIENGVWGPKRRSLPNCSIDDSLLELLDRNQFQYHIGTGLLKHVMMREIHRRLIVN
jgi:hypothetical protein